MTDWSSVPLPDTWPDQVPWWRPDLNNCSPAWACSLYQLWLEPEVSSLGAA